MNDTPIRVRVIYAKSGNLRFVGHLDSQRMFERALRRTKLPLRYTQGFNKHLRINLASALPLGFIGEAEVLDFWMNEVVDPALIKERLTLSLPKEIEVQEVKLIDNSLPSLQGSIRSSEYEILFSIDQSALPIESEFEKLFGQDQVLVTRRDKTVDIKPMVLELKFDTLENGQKLLTILLSSSASANARPDDLLALLGFDPAECRIKRTKLNFEE